MTRHNKEIRLRKKYLNELLDLKGNIRVLCRVRPLIREDGDSTQIVSFDPSDDGRLSLFSKGSLNTYEVDKVFRPESTQEQVFDEVKPLIMACIDGYNICIFAYGQTGAGKTFTMEGTPRDPGINKRSVKFLFDETSWRSDWLYTISVSTLEIYNEKLHDQLTGDDAKLDIKQGREGMYVPGLTEVSVSNIEDLNDVCFHLKC
ncbi:kinesin-like protein KIFC3 [Exaiptasia diaphana]|uniref:Kinesin motor domain-containing protein n=1 Tax=Exaiptasia diaphana TaxID=2652724 RepID=A0A913YHU2_EXADI|nr:kinesin-like protein KIFC3 [Exaiptasia diaphana]XP_028514077.1 kinesin-like protein KIFC3 [Exaiptasia diaphana]XP_028514078.1 kinesin-like protein KIFC3 [Exaiptasia diaphana]